MKHSLTELSEFLDDIVHDAHLEEHEKRLLQDIVHRLHVDEKNYMRNQAFKKANRQIDEAEFSVGKVMRWLERVVKQVTNSNMEDPKHPASVYFSPGKDCKNQIIKHINQAKHSLKVCVFTITDDDITKALINAHQNGVSVQVISDNDKAYDLGSDVHHLQKMGIALALDATTAHMHHKFMLVDNQILINGSFNWTRSATNHNQENIVVCYDTDLIKAFDEEFSKLWRAFT